MGTTDNVRLLIRLVFLNDINFRLWYQKDYVMGLIPSAAALHTETRFLLDIRNPLHLNFITVLFLNLIFQT